MLNWFRSSANYWMRALPNFSLSTLGQLAGSPAIRWPDCCSSGWPVSTSRATVLHFPKTSGNTVVHLRYDQQMFSIGDFDLSFLIQGVQGGFSVPRQIRYTLYYYVEFRHLTVFALYRMGIYPAQPMGGSPFSKDSVSETENCSKISYKTAFCRRHDSEVLAIKANSNFPNLIRQSSDWFF